MSFIASTIRRESENLLRLQTLYESELAALPKGSLRMKKRGSKQYYYLSYRDGKRVVSEYVGNDEAAAAKLEEQIEQRKHIEAILKNIRQEMRFADKILEGTV
ncbi:MAG: hypothetical protein LBL82_02340 [Oscillospiraceae bacterium]|jgi:hypothetical protein|nr:hypothetical protein [Oscillospiraceae bacterium]